MKDKVRTTLSSPYTKKLACGNCRRSKLKCDRVKPCTSCNLRGLQDQCYQSSQVEGTDQDVSRVDQTHIGESLSSPSLAQVNATLQGQHKAVSSLLSLVNESKLLSSSEERTWQDDVAQSLPSPQDCNVLLNFCYQNLAFHALLIERKHLSEIFDRLNGHFSVDRVEAALLLVTLASAAQMMPALHTLRPQISSCPELQHAVWLSLADKIKPAHRVQVASRGDQRSHTFIMEIILETIFAIYFSQSGRDDELWDVLGSAIRKGYCISLFDERNTIWKSLSESEVVRRKKLALCLALMDGWAAFNRMRPPGIQSQYFHVSFNHEACKAGVYPLIGELDPRQLPIIPRCHDFILNYGRKSDDTRYAEASSLCDEIKSRTDVVLSSLGIDAPLDVLPSLIPTLPEEQRVPLLACVSTSSYSACIMTRRFLTDTNAPAHLRFVSLQHAQNILATVPVCTAIMQEKRLPINPAWNANQLLCAASAFAVILIGRDDYLDTMALPFRQDSMCIQRQEAKMRDGQTQISTSPVHLLQEQLDWLSTWIFDILDCLQVIHASNGNHTTQLCLKILQGMCKFDRNLREASHRRYDKSSPLWQDTEEPNISNNQEMLDLINLVWPDQGDIINASDSL